MRAVKQAMTESTELEDLRAQTISLAEKNERLSRALGEARSRLASMQEQLDKVLTPPQTVGRFVQLNNANAQVIVAGRPLEVAIHSDVDVTQLRAGCEVLLDEHQVLSALAPPSQTGDIVTVLEVVDETRIIAQSGSGVSAVLRLGADLVTDQVAAGDSLRADLRAGFALEKLVRKDVEQMLVPHTEEVEWSDIGGLEGAIDSIREVVELPFQNPQLFSRYGVRPPRGILLFGPPGCGKTLIAKAVATSLGRRSNNSCFLSIKGPELLNKFVGETERQIRAIFNRARQIAEGGTAVVIFFDEMEALFRTRGSGISSDVETTVVPQLLAEIDGVETLENVIVIGASNREDMIDPAILRPGRLDIRIHVGRPDVVAARQILRLNLPDETPLAPNLGKEAAQLLDQMCQNAANQIYSRTAQTAIAKAQYPNGQVVDLYLSDVASGAMLENIASRAKTLAIKHTIEGGAAGMTYQYLLEAIAGEVKAARLIMTSVNPLEWNRINGALLGEGATLLPWE